MTNWKLPIINLPQKIEAGDSIVGYFPFISYDATQSIPKSGTINMHISLSRGKAISKKIVLRVNPGHDLFKA